MKKYLVFILLILISCEKDEIIEPTPAQQMIFDSEVVSINDGQDILFEILTSESHELIITTQNGSVLTKETFQPTLGINTRKIYTKILPKETLILTLQNTSGIVNTTSIIVE